MRSLLRALLTTLAILCGMSAGGGDSGVWILPLSSNVSAGGSGLQCREHWATKPMKDGVVMQVSSEMDSITAALHEVGSNLALPIEVSGNKVVVPQTTLQALLSPASSGVACGIVLDVNGRGYVIKILRIASTSELRIEIY